MFCALLQQLLKTMESVYCSGLDIAVCLLPTVMRSSCEECVSTEFNLVHGRIILFVKHIADGCGYVDSSSKLSFVYFNICSVYK